MNELLPLRFVLAVSVSAHPTFLWADEVPYKPSKSELRASYARADRIGRESAAKAFKLRLEPRWLENGKRMWYRNDLSDSGREFWLVDSTSGTKAPAFDHARLAKSLAAALGREVDGEALPFREIEFLSTPERIRFEVGSQAWECDLKDYTIKSVEAPARRRPPAQRPWRQDMNEPETQTVRSPDGKWAARIDGGEVKVKSAEGGEFVLAGKPGGATYHARLTWTPDSKRLLTTRVTPGDRKLVYLFESTPSGGGPSQVQERVYDRPGDRVDTFEMRILDVGSKRELPVQADILDYGQMPWIRWRQDRRHFTYEKMDRGYGRWRIIEVDSLDGSTRTVVDEDPPTFVDSTSQYVNYLRDSDDILWRSERDGWGHLYLTTGEGKTSQITKGAWVVRSVIQVDSVAKQITFQASGMNAKEDPYFLHYYRINFDGSNLVPLTPAMGNHSVQFSPDGATYVDSYSTVTQAPVHELRRASDGKLLATLEKADISELLESGWKAPEPFVAKARDGKTDIYGLVFRPSNFDPKRKYPVIEDIYAGPQDSFVPKSFSASHYDQSVAELGFIVVKIDGMGTRNRGKAFHDVAYKNLGDAGLPDRILWMKALAKKDKSLDLSRVGVFGTSAGGQNSTGALLFQSDFYKVAVSSCGCHDNRLDKIWWNEQWMGFPVGKEYDEQSNITNAPRLQGKLLLMVGELDDNVPPESTYRLADALIKANKEFELVVLPGLRHTAGGSFGERKRRDFFVRHLMGVEPPDWNNEEEANGARP